MHTSGSVVAVDLGATSGRVIVGHVDGAGVRMEHVVRFANGPVPVWEGEREALHWDALELYRQVRLGLRDALARHHDVASIGIDSWAVDYGIVRAGRITHQPYHYRDERNDAASRSMLRKIGKEALFGATACSTCRSTRCSSCTPTSATVSCRAVTEPC